MTETLDPTATPDLPATLPPAATEVLRFWFGDSGDDARILAEQGKLWWSGGAALDADITARFGALVDRAVAGELAGWSVTPRGNLARVLLLDQFTRNVYRRQGRAFAGDPLAQKLVADALDRGDDRALLLTERIFLYMPLEHAEDLASQARCLALFEKLAAEAPDGLVDAFRGFVGYAERHRAIIERFGRFPHRNPALGRAHTAEEEAWLKGGGDTFGQG